MEATTKGLPADFHGAWIHRMKRDANFDFYGVICECGKEESIGKWYYERGGMVPNGWTTKIHKRTQRPVCPECSAIARARGESS